MKKIIITILTLAVTLFALCSCGQENALTFDGSFWLDSYTESDVVSVYEKITYNVASSTETSSYSYNSVYTPDLTGTYVTELRDDELDGIKCYKLVSTLSVTGSYDKIGSEDKVEVNDQTVSTVYFLGKKDGLVALKSEKSVRSTSPSSSSGDAFTVLDYSVSCVYDYADKKVNVKFTYNDEVTEKAFYGHKAEFSSEIKNSTVDNELMIFVMRGMKIKDDFNLSFTTFEPVGAKVYAMTCKTDSDKPSDTVSVNGFVLDGITKGVENFNVDSVLFSINSTYSGMPIKVGYAVHREDNSTRHRPVTMSYVLPYGLGELKYVIAKVQTCEE